MGRFVCVRVTEIGNINHALFRFDHNLSFALMFMNADRTIYGRYGTRSKGGLNDARAAERDISLEGCRESMEKALQLHEACGKDPRLKKALAGKTGPSFKWGSTAWSPSRSPLGKGTNGHCVHCHAVAEEELLYMRETKKPVIERDLWAWPMPDLLGFRCDPKTCGTIRKVTEGSEAQRAGLREGDEIVSMDNQPILSLADIQWVLHWADSPRAVRMVVDRGGERVSIDLPLPEGWRRRGEFSWRYSQMELRWKVLGLDELAEASTHQRAQAGVPDGRMAIRIGRVITDRGPLEERHRNFYRRNCNLGPDKAGVEAGDLIVGVDGKDARMTVDDFMAYVLQEKKRGESIRLVVTSGHGESREVAFSLRH